MEKKILQLKAEIAINNIKIANIGFIINFKFKKY